MSAETWAAIIAGATFMVFWTASILGLAAYISNKLEKLRDGLLKNFEDKHEANHIRYDALSKLVTIHETILSREFAPHIPNRSPNGH